MSNRTLALTDRVYDYLLRVTVHEPDVLARLRAETMQLPLARMQIAPEQGQFMAFLVEMLGARRALEIGVFTGYSALWTALALPDDGQLVACDVNEEWTSIARRYWKEAGVDRKIELRLAPALETIATLPLGAFDFVFIDADKDNYSEYYRRAVELVRVGGVIAIDNALWSGDVADEQNRDPDTVAIRAVNAEVVADSRVSVSLVPIGDGLLLARKR